MTDGLKAEHRERMLAILEAHPRVERVVLFGSRALGTAKPASDVDLALFGAELSLDDLARLGAQFEALPMAQRVDLVHFESIELEDLRRHIEEHGVEWIPRRPAVEG